MRSNRHAFAEQQDYAPLVNNPHIDTRVREGVRAHEAGGAGADDEDVDVGLFDEGGGHGGRDGAGRTMPIAMVVGGLLYSPRRLQGVCGLAPWCRLGYQSRKVDDALTMNARLCAHLFDMPISMLPVPSRMTSTQTA